MPSRSRGWSSTERTRITRSLRLPAEQPESSAPLNSPVCNRAWNAQLDLRAGPSSAPDIQLRTDLLGALADSRQTVVAGAAFLQDFLGDAAAIIPDTQPEQTFTIPNFRFN